MPIQHNENLIEELTDRVKRLIITNGSRSDEIARKHVKFDKELDILAAIKDYQNNIPGRELNQLESITGIIEHERDVLDDNGIKIGFDSLYLQKRSIHDNRQCSHFLKEIKNDFTYLNLVRNLMIAIRSIHQFINADHGKIQLDHILINELLNPKLCGFCVSEFFSNDHDVKVSKIRHDLITLGDSLDELYGIMFNSIEQNPNQLNVPIPVQLFEDQDQGASGNCSYPTEVNEHIENNSSANNRIFSQDEMFQELVLDIVKILRNFPESDNIEDEYDKFLKQNVIGNYLDPTLEYEQNAHLLD